MDTDLLAVKIMHYLDAKIDDGICLAFSGGVDSALLLHFLAECQGDDTNVLAATFDTPLHPQDDFELTRCLANLYEVRHVALRADVLDDEHLAQNPVDRCYRCKKMLFAKLKDVAAAEHIRWIMDGTNADDLQQFRPGIQALKELHISSPWAELGVSKEEIRKLAHKVLLPVADRPSTPCMATRFPYGARLDVAVMQKLAAGEKLVRDFEIGTVRLRYYDGLVRIEVDEKDFCRLLLHKNKIIAGLKKLDFRYITLDLEGFRSGSMDTMILN